MFKTYWGTYPKPGHLEWFTHPLLDWGLGKGWDICQIKWILVFKTGWGTYPTPGHFQWIKHPLSDWGTWWQLGYLSNEMDSCVQNLLRYLPKTSSIKVDYTHCSIGGSIKIGILIKSKGILDSKPVEVLIHKPVVFSGLSTHCRIGGSKKGGVLIKSNGFLCFKTCWTYPKPGRF